jgi:glycine/D-amino acid oxidase-like deaminating enzyme
MAAVSPHAPIRWEQYDDQGDAAQAVARAVEVIADGGFTAVLGHFNSVGAARALPLYGAAGLPVLLPLATAPDLVGPTDIALTFCPDDNGQAAVIGRACWEYGPGPVTVVPDGTEYGRLLADRIRNALPDSVQHGPGGTLVLCGSHHRVGALLSQRPAGDGPVLVTDDCDLPEFTDLVGAAGVGVRVARIVGGPLARVVASFAALTAAISKYPDRRGTALLDAVRDEAIPCGPTPAGWQVEPLARPNRRTDRYDVAVLGAGVVGLATAAELAEAGVRVAVVTGDAPETAASAVSGALVRAFDPDPVARERSTRAFRLLWGRRDLGPWYGFRRTGALVLLAEADLDTAAAGVAALRCSVDAELLGPGEVAERWPELDTTGLAGAVWEPGGGYAIAAVALAALLDRAQRAGAVVYAGRRAFGPLADGGPVELAGGGRVHADRIVVAAGCGSPELLGDWWPADRPHRTKLIRYGVFASGGRALPTVVDATTGMWGRPDGGDGFLAGWPVPEWNVPVSAGSGLTEAQVEELRLGVSERLPFLAKADLLTGRYGTDLYVTGGPFLGRVPGTSRLFAATGWSGSGFKTAPAAAHQMAAELVVPALRDLEG